MSVFSTVAAAVRNSIPALRDAAHTLAVARERIAAIDAEIAAVDRLPPSRDEIVSLYTRHIDEDDFVADFKRWHLNAATLAAMSGTELASHTGAHVLAVSHVAPAQNSLITHPAYSSKLNEAVEGENEQEQAIRLRRLSAAQTLPTNPSMRAIEFVLAPLLRTRVAELIDKALPPGYTGITTAERIVKTKKLKQERAKLVEEVADLESALAQMGMVSAAPTTAGSDAVNLTARQKAEKIVATRLDHIVGLSTNQATDKVEAALLAGDDIDAALSGEQS